MDTRGTVVWCWWSEKNKETRGDGVTIPPSELRGIPQVADHKQCGNMLSEVMRERKLRDSAEWNNWWCSAGEEETRGEVVETERATESGGSARTSW
jgi:hypothetical protein